MHPGWEMVTFRDPLDPADWPITGHLHAECEAGAQLAGLVRLEAVWQMGGFYIDSDVQPLRSFEPLRQFGCVAGYEDDEWIADAVFGAEAHHPAIGAALSRVLTLSMHDGPSATGPRNLTHALRDRDDVTLLLPVAFYEVGYKERDQLATRTPSPDAYARHWWAGSWLTT
jgi:mannosyltransferase OCH1-like enzyme